MATSPKQNVGTKHGYKVGDVIHIKNGIPDNMLGHAGKKEKTEILWISDDHEDHTIHFSNSSPFGDDTFIVPAHGAVNSGPATQAAQPDKTYYYQVHSNPVRLAANPGIKIDP